MCLSTCPKLLLKLLTILIATRPLLAADPPRVPEPRKGIPSVYVDRSHEYLFAQDDLTDKVLAPIGFDVILADCSLEAAGDLTLHRVVVLMQTQTPSILSAAEEKLIRKYVQDGGTLLLITCPKAPAQRLARSFGFGFRENGTPPLLPTKATAAQQSPGQIAARSVPWLLVPPKNATILFTDAKGQPVAAGFKQGAGRVVVWADDGTYWDFCAQRDQQGNVASTPATQALFRWLVEARSEEKGRRSSVDAEIVENFGGLIVRYSKPIAPAAKALTAKIPGVIKVVTKWNGQGLPTEHPYTIHFLAGGGGGWAGPEAAGICVYGNDFPIRVMGHELTHSIANPLPAVFGEGWAVFVGLRAGEAMGGAPAAQAELDSILRRLNEVDPNRDRLDLMRSDQGPYNPDCQHKAVWMLGECHRRFGSDFMARVLKLRDQRFGVRKPITLAQTFELFAEVSGDPRIYDWYKAIGLSAKPPKP